MCIRDRFGLVVQDPELLLDEDRAVHLIAIDALAQVLVDFYFALETLAELLGKVVHALVHVDALRGLPFFPAGGLIVILCL